MEILAVAGAVWLIAVDFVLGSIIVGRLFTGLKPLG